MQLHRALRLRPGDVVALVGGGGKTTLMFRLASDLAASGRRVISTTTTRLFAGQTARAPLVLAARHEEELWRALPAALDHYGHVLVIGGVEAGKARGIPPQWVDDFAADGLADVIIVEADGARQLPFKAPGPNEPVVPASTTVLVPVAGLDALGRPLAAGHVHRPERVGALTGALPGDPITAAMIAAVLAHPEGGASGLPPGARLAPFLNKVEDEATLAAARSSARLLLAAPRVDSVLIGAVQADEAVREVWGRAGAAVLAAGRASRFGELKQLLPWNGAPLVAHVAGQALACPDIDRVAVTIGAGGEQVAAALAGQPLAVAPVPDWEAGQSRSVQAGLHALLAPGAVGAPAGEKEPGALSAALFLLADQPGVSPELLSALVQRHRETLAPVVAPRHEGQRGNPVLFDRATFPEFAALRGDVGARPLLQMHQEQIAWVDWPTAGVLQDIDTPADYDAPD